MDDRVQRAPTFRFRTAGGVAGLVMGVAVAFVPGGYAQAAPSDGPPGVTTASAGAGAVLPQRAMPPGAVRTTEVQPKPGEAGAPFQKVGEGRSGTTKIIGGAVGNIADTPWVVGIKTYFLATDQSGQVVSYVSYCTGTVISPTKVLTAGHCTVDMPFGTTFVIAGRNDLDSNSGGFVARVATTWTHPSYNYAAQLAGSTDVPVDDVAVLSLKDALPSAYPAIPFTAQDDQTAYADGTTATILGYGVTTNADNARAGVLHKATVQIHGDSTCGTVSGYDPTRMTCAGNPNASNPDAGVDSCHGDSGGPIVVNGIEVGITDWGRGACGSSYGMYERLSYYSNLVGTEVARAARVNLDWSGDGHSDLIGRDSAGRLVMYSGAGFSSAQFNGFSGSAQIGTGWGAFLKLFRVTDWNGDGTESIMGVQPGGSLIQYTSDGQGNFTNQGTLVGTGWNAFADIMVVNNWTGDGHPNLLARNTAGELFLYTSDGQGGWLNNGIGIRIGTGWSMFNTVLTPGVWSVPGRQSLIGRTPAGVLLLYTSDGQGGWLNNGVGQQIGTGWNIFRTFMSPGDWNGDDMVDLIGVTTAGAMRLYKTDGQGGWLESGTGQQIGTGWGIYNTIF